MEGFLVPSRTDVMETFFSRVAWISRLEKRAL